MLPSICIFFLVELTITSICNLQGRKLYTMSTNEVYLTTGVSLETLRLVLLANVVSTTLHYPHNYLKAEQYPPIWPIFPNPLSFRVSIIIFWPLLSILGYIGYHKYKSGTIEGVRSSITLLGAYSLLGTTSIGHFLGGVPQIHWFFFATMFTDFFAGCALLWLLCKIKYNVDSKYRALPPVNSV